MTHQDQGFKMPTIQIDLSPEDIIDLIDDLVDDGLSRVRAEAVVAEWVRARAAADRIDAVLVWGDSATGQALERIDGDAIMGLMQLFRRLRDALRKDPAKVAARKQRRKERKAARLARREVRRGQ